METTEPGLWASNDLVQVARLDHWSRVLAAALPESASLAIAVAVADAALVAFDTKFKIEH